MERSNLLAEASRYADGLPRLDHVLQRDAGNALELLPRPVAGQMEEHPDGSGDSDAK